MRQKQLTVCKTQTGKRWSLTVSGSDKDLLRKLQWAIRATATANNAAILNAADPFGSDGDSVVGSEADGVSKPEDA